jgi:hypothetical protein
MVYISRHLSYVDLVEGERQTVTEADLADVQPPAVILGEPGMGKSGLLKNLAAQDSKFELISALALKRRQAAFASGKIVLVDGLDELPGARDEDPIQDVLTKLAELGSPPFFLSCRANDWRDVAKESIREDYGREPVEYRIAPLTEAEAVTFLSVTHGEDAARDFVATMEKQGVSEFYGNPLTLQLIDRVLARGGVLPLDRADLFSRASDLLRQEQNPRRPYSPLSSLSKVEALGALGAACAALILTGSEAINVGAQGATQEGDLHLSEVAALPGAGALGVALSATIFERRDGGGDRLVPFHKTMAEYLAASWIAGQTDHASGRRLLAMMTYQGGVPASLRGVHAWLAYFSPVLRPTVIAADPYGVLRYGDAAYLAPVDARLLIRALERLSTVDPWFAFGDDRHHRAPALTQAGMVDELRRVLLAPQSAFQLKSILLLALPGSEAAPDLLPDLEAIFMSPQPAEEPESGAHSGFTFHERSAAFDVLVEHLPRKIWSAKVETLMLRPGEDDRRLAVETITAVGSEHFTPELIARAAMAYAGLLDEANALRKGVSAFGDLYILSRAVPVHQVGAVLDAMVAQAPPTKNLSWRAAYEFSGFVDFVLAKALDAGPVDALRALGWLRLIAKHDRSEAEAVKAIQQRLLTDAALRRAIQRQIVLVEAAASQSIDWVWSLHETNPALAFTDEDVVEILTSANLPDLSDSHTRETWQRLVAERRNQKGLPSTIAAAARAMAQGDADLEAFVDKLDQPHVPDWVRKEKIRKWRSRAKDRRLFERRRIAYFKLRPQIAEGSWTGLSQAADVYFARFSDVDREASPRERLMAWIGEDLAELMLAGFEAALHRVDLPLPETIGEKYVEGRTWRTTSMLMAGACERGLAGRDLEDLTEDVVVAIAAGEILDHTPDTLGKMLRAQLAKWFRTRPAAWERTWRLALEPQLRVRKDHVMGLHRLVRPKNPATRVLELVAEWLERFTDLPTIVEAELLDALSREGRWETLKALADARETLGYRDDDHRLVWLAITFFADFEASKTRLEATAAAHPNLFWTIRRRGWPSESRGRGRTLGVEPLAWLVRTFRGPFPSTSRPMGSSSGDENAWDATDFLQAMIRRLAADPSDEAVTALATLRDGPADGYEAFLKNACAQQLRARRDASFAPLSLDQVSAVLSGRAPTSAADLQALVLDALATVQGRMNRDAEGQVEMFHGSDGPKDEEACRDALAILLRDLVGHGVVVTSEDRAPNDKRADMVFSLNQLRLPLEAKGQWHDKLWVAANEQLDAYYAIEYRARNLGIYLVFWFGPDVPETKRLQSPGRGVSRPETAEALREALVARVAEHRRGQIAVVVLDVSRQVGANLIPTAPAT